MPITLSLLTWFVAHWLPGYVSVVHRNTENESVGPFTERVVWVPFGDTDLIATWVFGGHQVELEHHRFGKGTIIITQY